MRWVALVLGLAACDPAWGVHARVRDPSNRALESATLAVACPDSKTVETPMSSSFVMRSDATGAVHVGGMGFGSPVGCDLYVAKPGYRTLRLRYREMCPAGPDKCDSGLDFDFVLEPE